MGNVIIVKTDGTYTVKALEKPSLEMMYREIGCDTVDLCRLEADIDMWMSDTYGVQMEPINISATMFNYAVGTQVLTPIRGTVFFAKHDGKGETIGLNLYEQRTLCHLLDKIKAELK